MKRPEKIVMWFHVHKEKTGYVNHLEKPLYKFSIKLPSWVGLAYRPRYAKIEINENPMSWAERDKDSNREEIEAYVKSNWSKKLTKMRKLNNNYIQIFTLARGDEHKFLSREDYKHYHDELRELNAKYGVGKSVNNGGDRT